jgi:hypothetical protein
MLEEGETSSFVLGWVTKHEDIEQTIHTHFKETMKGGPRQSRDFNWGSLHLPKCDLSSLADDFTKEEVHGAIRALPSEKAPGPDGFTGVFFKACWGTIKEDLMKVINLFSNLHSENFHWLNSANIVLIPKKEGANPSLTLGPLASSMSWPRLSQK